jgi:hypothetical protein
MPPPVTIARARSSSPRTTAREPRRDPSNLLRGERWRQSVARLIALRLLALPRLAHG